MYHKAKWYGTQLCDNVGIDKIEYDFGSGYSTNNTHTFNTVGEYTVKARATNKCGLSTEDSGIIKITNNKPIVKLSYSPHGAGVGENITVTIDNNDVDNTIKNQTYYNDGVETDKLVVNYDISGEHEFKVVTVWNDGFEDKTMETVMTISIKNAAPEFELVDEDKGNNTVKFILNNATDPDGDDNKLNAKWVIKFQAPMSGEWITVQNSGYPNEKDLSPKTWVFNESGKYRISAIVKDELGAETEHTIEKDFECNSTGSARLSGHIKLDVTAGKINSQLIAIPVRGKKVKEYFLDWIDAKIKEYDNSKGVKDVIERVTAFPGNTRRPLTFIPGVTPVTHEGNFSLVTEDGVNINEIVGFWVAIKDYKDITNGEDLIFEWNTDGA